MSNQITITSALAWATAELRKTSTTPRLDAELLLAHVLGRGRAHVLAGGTTPLAGEHLAGFRALIARRAQLEPVAYLVGHKEFFGLDFVVDRRVLVPRPETELLVELALDWARQLTTDNRPLTLDQIEGKETRRQGDKEILNLPISLSPGLPVSAVVGGRRSVVVADIGTGSGCIAIALAKHLPAAEVIAVDISPDALEVARTNAERHGVAERVRLVQGDLLAPLDRPVDLLVSNPPYTVLSEIDAGVRRHEPRGALDGGPDGLDLYWRLLAEAPARLRPGGAVLLEIGATQGAAVSELARQHFPAAQIAIHKDLAGLDRVVVIDDSLAERRGDRVMG